jgi:hypothetical protein
LLYNKLCLIPGKYGCVASVASVASGAIHIRQRVGVAHKVTARCGGWVARIASGGC